MKFLNPAALWLLLGVPILIIIYLIKTRHEDRAVSSTYIWHLSDKFSKKKMPIQKIRRSLLFILQLLIIVAVALLAARPYIYDGEIRSYVVILDASASMGVENEDGESRFERAVEEIDRLGDGLENGHSISLIVASDSSSCVLRNTKSQGELRRALEKLSCGLGECDLDEALNIAEELCVENSNAEAMLYTDREFESAENITVVNMNEGEWNASATSLSYEKQGISFVFSGTVISSGKSSTLTVGLMVDDTVISAHKVECPAGVQVPVSFTVEDISSFDYATLYFDAEDGLADDNSYSVCRPSNYTRNVLLASKSPLYLRSALEALGNCKVTTVYDLGNAELSGFSIYIFDGIYPESYPTDGSVIIFGCENLPSGLSAGDEYATQSKILINTSDSTGICENITFSDVVVSKYTALRGNSAWQNILLCGDIPVAMTRQISRVNFTVFSFDLHDSNLPMETDYVIMMQNLIDYSAADIVEKTDYSIGESVDVYLLPRADLVYLKNPDESVTTLSTDSAKNLIIPDKIGIYTVVETIGESGEYADFYVHIPTDELDQQTGKAISLSLAEDIDGDAEDGENEAIYEIWFWLALLLLLMILAEWGVYSYEQY